MKNLITVVMSVHNVTVAVRRPRTLSGGAIMLRHNLQSRQSLGSISDYVHHEEGSVLEIVDAGFTWDSKTDRVELKGLNLNIEAGMFIWFYSDLYISFMYIQDEP